MSETSILSVVVEEGSRAFIDLFRSFESEAIQRSQVVIVISSTTHFLTPETKRTSSYLGGGALIVAI
jgi:hypothetical protein